MSDPTDMPFQEDRVSREPEDSIYEGRRPEGGGQPEELPVRHATDVPPKSETDRLAEQVSGVEDQVGMAALWRATMDLEHWWFIAVGDDGMESPAAALIDERLMLLTFTTADRARHFAVENGMVAPDEDLRAIALPPREVVDSAQTYDDAGIAGLMFDPHLAGYFISSEQLPVVWDAVYSTSSDVDPAQPEG